MIPRNTVAAALHCGSPCRCLSPVVGLAVHSVRRLSFHANIGTTTRAATHLLGIMFTSIASQLAFHHLFSPTVSNVGQPASIMHVSDVQACMRHRQVGDLGDLFAYSRPKAYRSSFLSCHFLCRGVANLESASRSTIPRQSISATESSLPSMFGTSKSIC